MDNGFLKGVLRVININKVFNKYDTRIMSYEDIDEIYNLCRHNVMYYKHLKESLSKEGIRDDLLALPPGITNEYKYYIGFYENKELIAVIDLIEGYPSNDIAYIGFFMMNIEKQGLGIGSSIIEELAKYLSSINMKKIRLAYVVGNKQSENFWRKNGFISTGELKPRGEAIVSIMEKHI